MCLSFSTAPDKQKVFVALACLSFFKTRRAPKRIKLEVWVLISVKKYRKSNIIVVLFNFRNTFKNRPISPRLQMMLVFDEISGALKAFSRSRSQKQFPGALQKTVYKSDFSWYLPPSCTICLINTLLGYEPSLSCLYMKFDSYTCQAMLWVIRTGLYLIKAGLNLIRIGLHLKGYRVKHHAKPY